MPTMDPDSSTTSPGKEKKRRRRLRLSCIECTKRRQRCDRAHPACGLCISRGVEHLCQWATVPFARPTPVRLHPLQKPVNESYSEDNLEIQQLLDRIRVLERQLDLQCTTIENSPYLGQCSSTSSGAILNFDLSSYPPYDLTAFSPEYAHNGTRQSLAPQNETNPTIRGSIAWSFAYPSLGRQEEFVGPSSSVYALLQMDKRHTPDIQSVRPNGHSCFNIFMQSNPDQNIQLISLIQKLPPPLETGRLLSAYFAYFNWNFGLPEIWIRTVVSRMWDFLHHPASIANDTQLNPSWLCLFYAILACVPSINTIADYMHNDEQFTACSNAALRMASDAWSVQTTTSKEGSILACVAVSLLGKKYAALGRSSEAWQLLGNWIRMAQSLESHHHLQHECENWSDEEQALWKLAWNNLAIWDRFYSSLLGRPSMHLERFSDAKQHQKSTDRSPTYLEVLHDLSLLAEDTNKLYISRDLHDQWIQTANLGLRKCLARMNELAPIFEIDRITGTAKRFTLFSWYLFLKMKLCEKICALSQDAGTASAPISNHESVVNVCIELIEVYCIIHDGTVLSSVPKADPDVPVKQCRDVVSASLFHSENLLMLLETSVTLLLQIEQHPIRHLSIDVVALLGKVCQIFHVSSQQISSMSETYIVYAGLAILQSFLQNEHSGISAHARQDRSDAGRGLGHPLLLQGVIPNINSSKGIGESTNACTMGLFEKASIY